VTGVRTYFSLKFFFYRVPLSNKSASRALARRPLILIRIMLSLRSVIHHTRCFRPALTTAPTMSFATSVARMSDNPSQAYMDLLAALAEEGKRKVDEESNPTSSQGMYLTQSLTLILKVLRLFLQEASHMDQNKTQSEYFTETGSVFASPTSNILVYTARLSTSTHPNSAASDASKVGVANPNHGTSVPQIK
jgi:hypothetical protein